MTSPSPCLTCDTLADCRACLPRLRWEVTAAPIDEPDECLTCLDAGWLLEVGEHFDQVAHRLGIQPDSLEQHLRRHHQPNPTHRRTA